MKKSVARIKFLLVFMVFANVLFLTSSAQAIKSPATFSNDIKITIPQSIQAKQILSDSLKTAKVSATRILNAFLPDYNAPEFQKNLIVNIRILLHSGFTLNEVLDAIHTLYKYMPYTAVAKLFYEIGPGPIRELTAPESWANDLMQFISVEYNVSLNPGDGIFHLKKAAVPCRTTFGYFSGEMNRLTNSQVLGSYFRRFSSAGYSTSEIYLDIVKPQVTNETNSARWHKAFCFGLKLAQVSAKEIGTVLKAQGQTKLAITEWLQFAGFTATEILGAL